MNRGNIPGFYYDVDKKKYFKITANHAAPVNAKYSKTNAKRQEQEERAVKKRKLDESETRKQTVNQASALKSGLLRTTLQREGGLREYSHLRAARDEALIDEFQYSKLVPRIKGYSTYPPVKDAHYAADRSCMLLATTHNASASCAYSYDWSDDMVGVQHLKYQMPVVTQPGTLLTMQNFDQLLLLVSNTGDEIQYYLGPAGFAVSGVRTLFPTLRFSNTNNTAHACAFDPATRNMAFVGTGLTVINGMTPDHVGGSNFGDTKESFAATWLQPNVLAYGLQTEMSKRAPSHKVCLWDVRVGSEPSSTNSTTRLKRQHRVTGVEKLQENQLLVTSNLELSVYDLRMRSAQSPPLLSIPHTSAGPRLNFAVQGDLIAAVDERFTVQVYSLQSSRQLRTLKRGDTIESNASPMQQLRWQEDRRGSPYLQACADDVVHRWGWQS